MNESTRMIVVLVVISVLAGLAIGFTYEKTRDTIASVQAESDLARIRAALPAGTEVQERAGSNGLPEKYWVGMRGAEVVAYAFVAAGRGYSSDVRVVAGVDTAGRILGLAVLDQKETPGLGTRVSEVASKRYIWSGFGGSTEAAEPWFTEQFEGLDLDSRISVDKSGEWHTLGEPARTRLEESNTVSAISGATISTRAVIRALETGVYPYVRALRGGM